MSVTLIMGASGSGKSTAIRTLPEDKTLVISISKGTGKSLPFKGWKTSLSLKNAWIKYNAVDFGTKKYKSVQVNALSSSGGTIQIRLDNAEGAVLSEIKIPKSKTWQTSQPSKTFP